MKNLNLFLLLLKRLCENPRSPTTLPWVALILITALLILVTPFLGGMMLAIWR